jgi:DNA polymerase III subunit gamma/tau
VASILLSNASVVSVQDGVLTLRFAGEGELKRFSTSPYDIDLKRVLSAEFGLNVMVKGVVGAGQPENAAPRVVRSVAGSPEIAVSADEPPDDVVPDDVPPDEPSADDADAGPAELTGMDLIQRELGGQVISEIEG